MTDRADLLAPQVLPQPEAPQSSTAPPVSEFGRVLALQRSAGNAAVSRALAGRRLQRSPAAPSHQGQTGVRDPAKIRVDAVPDFLVASLASAPRTVNPHVLDAAIKHITWEFYDPADTMLTGSFSTRPGDTTTPFRIEASQFGAGNLFVQGRYLLRLVGLDDQHRPVAYADRDFNVLTADLTTNTGVSTGHGELKFTQWAANSAPSATGAWSVDVALSFLADASVASTDVVFIQALEYITADGRSFHRMVNAEQEARQTPLSWSIDRVAGAPQPFYIAGRNAHTGAVADVPGWGRAGAGGASPTAATLLDTPGGSATRGARQLRFESCAISRSGPTAGECYGCATWGISIDGAGQVTLMPRSVRPMPSEDFEEARQMWNTWRASRAGPNQPSAAPAVRRP